MKNKVLTGETDQAAGKLPEDVGYVDIALSLNLGVVPCASPPHRESAACDV